MRDAQGHILLERRPEKAMMGGMSAFPTSSWEGDIQALSHPDFLRINSNPGTFIRHSFTHFDLQLWLVEASLHGTPPEYFYTAPLSMLDQQGFPTLFKKAYKLWRSELMDDLMDGQAQKAV